MDTTNYKPLLDAAKGLNLDTLDIQHNGNKSCHDYPYETEGHVKMNGVDGHVKMATNF
jgi:hypothetical protein